MIVKNPVSHKERWGFVFATLQWFADILISCSFTMTESKDRDPLDSIARKVQCFTENISFSAV
jgi:hypothetical protein